MTETNARKNAAAVVECARCENAFKATRQQAGRAVEGKRVYCSRACQIDGSRTTIVCANPVCGQEVEKYTHIVTRNKTDVSFCSPECRNTSGIGYKPKTGRAIECEVCGTEAWAKPSQPTKRFCSKRCLAKAQERREDRTCPECQNTFEARLSDDTVFCSTACHGASRRAKPGERYVDKNGYAWVYVEEDGQVVKYQEHRYVMSQHIGRPLASWETVHHLTGGIPGRSNNDLTNLELWASRHPKGHRAEDIATYCREMLAVYGNEDEQYQYAEHSPLSYDAT